ncbi:11934_t:CDS:2 [Entrophospora sp. SA101]|nr:11934_t:CDS:2 [Entrophospora sp. SA101]CAJ0823477.1 5152_t:CDS:2 [Entrophospora sp. SA101]
MYQDTDLHNISQEDCWTVISSFFHDKGLVRQQLDSFDEFVQNTMQEIVDENKNLVLQTVSGNSSEGDKARRFYIRFGQVYLSRPTMTEADGSVQAMFPQEARLRNLTYAAPIYVNMKEEIIYADPKDPKNAGKTSLNEMFNESDLRTDLDENSYDKVFIGKVTI